MINIILSLIIIILILIYLKNIESFDDDYNKPFVNAFYNRLQETINTIM